MTLFQKGTPSTPITSRKEQWKTIGDKHYKAGRYVEALDAYNQAIDLDPTNTIVYRSKALTLNKLKHYEEALSTLEHFIHLDPHDAMAYANKGFALNELKHYEEALNALELAIGLNPAPAHAASVYINKGFALNELRRHEEALIAYEQAIRLNPKNPLAYHRKSLTLRQLGKQREAQKAHRKAQRIARIAIKGIGQPLLS